jgi:hypothetical protein
MLSVVCLLFIVNRIEFHPLKTTMAVYPSMETADSTQYNYSWTVEFRFNSYCYLLLDVDPLYFLLLDFSPLEIFQG